MLQLVQHQKSGELVVEELPVPQCIDNGILVKNHFSLISAGTEKVSVENTKGSLLARARKQPEQVKLVMDSVKQHGISDTIRRVQNKLESYKTLGYSAAGVVVESKCDEFSVGDRVAVAGAGYANHADFVTVPKNLAIKVPDNVLLEDASYTTVASIALQGVRQADPKLGESVAVIGLGLIGLITIQMLKAAGCRVAGIDINESLFENAEKFGAEACFQSSSKSIDKLKAFSRGIGFDSVIITAGTSSSEPLQLSMEIARQHGNVVIVGAVGMDLKRQPWYMKEVNLKISCSYGPGRYDSFYEEYGQDYPAGFVRWTENRNMQAVIDLISSGSLDVNSLTTHSFEIKDAPKAYEVISSNQDFTGIVLKYDQSNNSSEKFINNKGKIHNKGELRVSMIGAGQFAQNYLLPPLSKAGVRYYGVSTSSSVNAKTAADVHGFKVSTTDSSELIKSNETDIVFVATRHDTHAKFVLEAIKNGKAVFVEKPLAVNIDQLSQIKEEYDSNNGWVMTGFNRRFSPQFKFIKDSFKSKTQPMVVSYRVNAGKIPKGHWVQQKENGGRIIGEVCHFIDTIIYLTGELPVRVYAESISGNDLEMMNIDNVIINLKMSGGSVATIEYLANGGKTMSKEFCEVFCEGASAEMDNFNAVRYYDSKASSLKSFNGKKGIQEEVEEVIDAVKSGKEAPISFKELYYTTLTTFKILESLEKGQPIEVTND